MEQSIEEKVILGLPILTQYGELKALSINNYLTFSMSVGMLTWGKKKILAELGKAQQAETNETDKEVFAKLQELNKLSLFELLREHFSDLLHHYIIVTRYCKFFYLEKEEQETDEDYQKRALETSLEFLFTLDNDEFDEFRKILLTLHGQRDVKAFINPFLQKRHERGEKAKVANDKDIPNLTTMITSCAVYMGIDYSQIAKWNALQLQQSFQRIANFIDNSTTTLFRTVASDVEPVSWALNIANEDKNTEKTLDEFTKTVSNQLK